MLPDRRASASPAASPSRTNPVMPGATAVARLLLISPNNLAMASAFFSASSVSVTLTFSLYLAITSEDRPSAPAALFAEAVNPA